MFSYTKLLRLKKRDFELWAWKAQKALIEREMLLANTIRISQARNDRYHQFFSERRRELLRLDGKLKEVHKETWLELEEKGRG